MGFFKRNSLWKFSWLSIVLLSESAVIQQSGCLLGWSGWLWSEWWQGLWVLRCCLWHVLRGFGEIHSCHSVKIIRTTGSLHASRAAKKLVLWSCSSKKIYHRACMWCENSLRGVSAAALHQLVCCKVLTAIKNCNMMVFPRLCSLRPIHPPPVWGRNGDRHGVPQQRAQGCAQSCLWGGTEGQFLGEQRQNRVCRHWF